jgi:hypothetical protein
MKSDETVVDISLASFFLGRLARLVVKLAVAQEAEQRTALTRALLSTFLDCRDLGVEQEARNILDCLHAEPKPWPFTA